MTTTIFAALAGTSAFAAGRSESTDAVFTVAGLVVGPAQQ